MLTPSAYKRRQTVRKQTQRYVLVLLILSVLFFVGLLSGCGGTLPPCPPAVPQQLPAMPELTTPIPSRTYSASVLELLQTWQQRLTGTPAMR